MKTVAIIQARMSSTRLPGKVLADVAGKPMLSYVVERVRKARSVDLVVVATSDKPADDEIARFCANRGITCFRGSEDDVLDRFYHAAECFGAEIVVRLTADCPLLDSQVTDKVVQAFQQGAFDYVSNTLECTYPDGLDTEVFSRKALARSWNEARLKSEREHVTPYMYKHPELFRLGNVSHPEDLSALRWTVDEQQDLDFVRAVYNHLGMSSFGLDEVLDLLRNDSLLSKFSSGIERNEGYKKSLREDVLMEKAAEVL